MGGFFSVAPMPDKVPAVNDQPRLFSRPLEFVGARRAAVVAEQLEVYRTFQPVAKDTYFNYPERVFRSAGITLRTSPLGTYEADGLWTWAWASDETAPSGSPERELSLRLRQYGERVGAQELVMPRLDLSVFANPRSMAERLAVIAMGVLELPGYAVTVMPSGARQFSLIEDDAVPRARCEPELVPDKLRTATEIFPAAPHETTMEYLRHHGFVVEIRDATTLVGTREPGWIITVTFNGDNGVFQGCEVTAPDFESPAPAPVAVTPPPAPVPDGEQQRSEYLNELTGLINEIGGRLEQVLPVGWTEFRFDFAGTVSAGTVSLRAIMPSGQVETHQVPDDVMPKVMDLRAKMYSEIAGTWFGLTITSVGPGRYSVDFNNDNEPDTPDIKPEDYLRDLQQFPRSPDRMPEWLRRKLQYAQPVN
jgi:hypothetical protein